MSRPWRNARASSTSPLASVREAEELRQLADEDHDRRDRPGSRSAPGSRAGRRRTRAWRRPRRRITPDEEREHPGQRDGLLLGAGGERQDRRRDHRPERRVGAEDQDRRRPDEGVGDQADDGRVEARDRRQPGQLRVRHPLRHEQGHEHDARDQVARQPRPLVRPERPDAGHPVLDHAEPGLRRTGPVAIWRVATRRARALQQRPARHPSGILKACAPPRPR